MENSRRVDSSYDQMSKAHFTASMKSTASSVYFESQKRKMPDDVGEDDVDKPDKTVWERIKANWIAITIFALLLGSTILCVLIPVRSHTTRLSILRCTIDFISRKVLQVPACGLQAVCIGLASLRWEEDSTFPRAGSARSRILQCLCQLLVVSVPLSIGAGLLWIAGVCVRVLLARHQ
jgi:hypothetical protein